MSFPPTIKEPALVACGRHCCICHRFCGIKMELHHIVQPAEGGDDTFENCIPLCFDCHGDMRSYDHHHPKGTKYTPNELKGHRDRWYAKVQGTSVTTSPSQDRDLDRQTMQRLVTLLPWNGAIDFVRHKNFAGLGFHLGELRELSAFRQECENPTFEFIDSDVEGLRAALLAAIRRFQNVIGEETFPTGNSDVNIVPQEWEYQQPDHFSSVVKEIHDSASEICDVYDQLVRIGRRRLGVTGEAG